MDGADRLGKPVAAAMRRRAFVIALAGLASVAGALLLYRPFIIVDPPSAAALPEPEAPAPQIMQPAAPESAARPPGSEAPESAERGAPPSTVEPMRETPEALPRRAVLYQPVAVAAGLVDAQGYAIALAGIVATDVNEICSDNGASWPCGVHARTAFRNWLRGRALTCTVPREPQPGTVVSDCMLGGQNPAEWLVVQGWARAEPGGPYAALEEEARANRRGLFGPAPSGG